MPVSNAKAAAETALFAALAAGISGATVYQDVPEAAPLPIVVVGDLRSRPIGGKGERDRRISAVIVTVVAAEERTPLLELQRQIEDLLDGQIFIEDGWTLSVTFEDDDALLGEDGVTYTGSSAFDVIALAD